MSDSGTLGILRTFAVTSSPRVPLPLVAALTRRPLRNSSESAEPSSFGWHTNLRLWAVVSATKCATSSSVLDLSRLSMGNGCSTLIEPGGGSEPTFLSWGCSGCSLLSSSQSSSNSASDSSGLASL